VLFVEFIGPRQPVKNNAIMMPAAHTLKLFLFCTTQIPQ
jgi:hypothetical protein